MPTPTKGPRLGGGPAHERLILANLATALFEHKRITTTETKAKRLRPLAERLITFAKRGDLHARRRVMTVVKDKSVVHVLFTEIAPAVAERQGGYTRITKIGPRKGDNAPMAVIELVLEPLSPKQAVVKEATKAAAKAAPKAKKADPRSRTLPSRTSSSRTPRSRRPTTRRGRAAPTRPTRPDAAHERARNRTGSGPSCCPGWCGRRRLPRVASMSVPVVLVHGLRTSRTMWRAQLEALARAGRPAVAVDLPGHGTRLGEPFTLDERRRDGRRARSTSSAAGRSSSGCRWAATSRSGTPRGIPSRWRDCWRRRARPGRTRSCWRGGRSARRYIVRLPDGGARLNQFFVDLALPPAGRRGRRAPAGSRWTSPTTCCARWRRRRRWRTWRASRRRSGW